MTDYWHNQAGVPVVGNQKKKKKPTITDYWHIRVVVPVVGNVVLLPTTGATTRRCQ